MNRLFDAPCDPSQLSPLTLAFVGDTVYDLLVRESLVCDANRPVKALHKLACGVVNAASQAQACRKILPFLTEEETDVFKRGRNAHTNHKAKNMSESDYHAATGLECLFGYLYLSERLDRIRELFNLICAD